MLLFAVLCLLITGAPRATANADVHWHALRENTPHVIGALDASDPDGDVLFFRVINATAETRGDNGSEAGATKSLPCVVIMQWTWTKTPSRASNYWPPALARPPDHRH